MATFHIFIIGAASLDPQKRIQLPSLQNIQEWCQIYRNSYFYFIDPLHFENETDMTIFKSYFDNNILFTWVPLSFKFETFTTQYRIQPQEEALFIDFSGLTESELDFMLEFGPRSKWKYFTYNCHDGQLDLISTYEKAKCIVYYSLENDAPFNPASSLQFRRSISKRLEKIITYVRLLPSYEDEKLPPAWMIEKDPVIRNSSKEELFMLRENSAKILEKFFRINSDINIFALPSLKWYDCVQSVLNI